MIRDGVRRSGAARHPLARLAPGRGWLSRSSLPRFSPPARPGRARRWCATLRDGANRVASNIALSACAREVLSRHGLLTAAVVDPGVPHCGSKRRSGPAARMNPALRSPLPSCGIVRPSGSRTTPRPLRFLPCARLRPPRRWPWPTRRSGAATAPSLSTTTPWPGSSGSRGISTSPLAGAGRRAWPGSGSWWREAIRSLTRGGSPKSWWPPTCMFPGCDTNSGLAVWEFRLSARVASTTTTRRRRMNSSSRVGSGSRRPCWPCPAAAWQARVPAVAARAGLPRPVPGRIRPSRRARSTAGCRPHDPSGVAGVAGRAPVRGDPRCVRH